MLLVIRVIIKANETNWLPLGHRYNLLLLFFDLGLLAG